MRILGFAKRALHSIKRRTQRLADAFATYDYEKLSIVIGLLVGMVTFLKIPASYDSTSFIVVIFCGLLFAIASILRHWRTRSTTRTVGVGLPALVVLTSSLLMIAISLAHWFMFGKPRNDASKEHQRILASFETHLRTNRWISYDPPSADPEAPTVIIPQESDIQRDLKIIRHFFGGVCTFSSTKTHSMTPRIARELQFTGVIMGIINVTNREEIEFAIQQKDYVSAYCVGHRFDQSPYSEIDVLDCMREVWRRTHRPVTTTLRPAGYRAYPNISAAVDWFYPDIHAEWHPRITAAEAFDQTKQLVEEMATFVRSSHPNKPVLLKMVGLPYKELPAITEEEQTLFFQMTSSYFRSGRDFPPRITPSWFSAFDIPWKQPPKWPLGERYVGILSTNGTSSLYSSDVTNWVLLVSRLLDSSDPNAVRVKQLLSSELQRALISFDSSKTSSFDTQGFILSELNQFIASNTGDPKSTFVTNYLNRRFLDRIFTNAVVPIRSRDAVEEILKSARGPEN